MLINSQNIHIQPIQTLSNTTGVHTDMLRLDLIHPVISGNKWFKLKYYLSEAIAQQATAIVSFGGAYSNHIVALAYAGRIAAIPTIGFIRGDASTERSPTLQEAADYGMELIFIDRESYRNKLLIKQKHDHPGWYWIPEGGYGKTGAKGAADILKIVDTTNYTHIICATGTGTMMAGLIQGATALQTITGISVLKNHTSLEDEVMALLEDEQVPNAKYQFVHGYDFGGYAKHPELLLDLMRSLWITEKLPTDIVYTAKLVYAAKDLIAKQFFPTGSRLLLIHSGGLQGNRSLPANTLPF